MKWLIELVSLGLLAAGPVVVQSNYWHLPDRVPCHFNLRGEADAWSSRASIWLLPVLGFVLYGVMSAATWSQPSGPLMFRMGLLKAAMLAMFLAIERSIIHVALGQARRLDKSFWVFFVLTMVIAASLASVAHH